LREEYKTLVGVTNTQLEVVYYKKTIK